MTNTRTGETDVRGQATKDYEYVNAVWPGLAGATAENDEQRLRTAQALLRLGLGSPAYDVLAGASEAVRAHPEFASMIGGIPRSLGQQSWSDRRERFDANLQVLAGRGLDSEMITARWQDVADHYELHTDVLGVDQVRYRPAGTVGLWLPSLQHHPDLTEAAKLPPDIDLLMPGPYVFEGLDLGWQLARIHKRTLNTFLGYSTALYVVEPDPALLAIVLHLHDWTELLAEERVFIFIGEHCTRQLRQAWHDDLNLPLPTQAFTLSRHRPAPQPAVVEAATALIDWREQRDAEHLAEVEARYHGRDISYWARRYAEARDGTGPPLRILAAVSTHTSFLQYSMRDAKRAAERLGYEFELLIESRDYEMLGPSVYYDAMLRFDPDVFFVIDHIRAGLGRLVPSNLPVMCWDQDALPEVFTREQVAQMSPLDTIVGLPKFECLARFSCDPRQFLEASMPTCPNQWDAWSPSEEELDRYRCDVSYVSHASETPEAFHRAELGLHASPHVHRLLEDMYPQAVEAATQGRPVSGRLADEILSASEQRTGVRVTDSDLKQRLTGWYLWRLCDRVFRHTALAWAATWAAERGRTLRIYGNGWKDHPTLAPYSAGPAENGRELLCIYRASRINLQLMPAGFVHQRALDGLAAGGFFLGRATSGDSCEPGLRELDDRLRQGGFSNGAEVLASGDPALIDRFTKLRGRVGFRDNEVEEWFHHIRIYAAWDYATDVFPRFERIRFTDAESFATLADRFVDDQALREEFTSEMRNVVIERFSYEATLQRFLSFATDYYTTIAAEEPAPAAAGSAS